MSAGWHQDSRNPAATARRGLTSIRPSLQIQDRAMETLNTEQLIQRKCAPCEGGIPPMTKDEVAAFLPHVPGWTVVRDGQRIRREWRAKNFLAAIDFFNKVAELSESEGHHPDLHLEGYRNVAIELWTHAIGGLSENDFILAAKINQLPFAVKA